MQLEQEYEEKQMVIHEKHDLEGLIATLCDQVCNTHSHTRGRTLKYSHTVKAVSSCRNMHTAAHAAFIVMLFDDVV